MIERGSVPALRHGRYTYVMSIKHGWRKLFGRLGSEVVRLSKHHGVDCDVEVDANDDEFARELRRLILGGRIISFESLA